LKHGKCKISSAKVEFLGHTLQRDTIRPQTETVGRILDTDRPKTKKACIEVSLLGMINFYRRYIPNCADIIAPITELTKGRTPNLVKWGDKQEKAFSEIKRVLSSEPILKLQDLNREFTLQTDESNLSLGGMSTAKA